MFPKKTGAFVQLVRMPACHAGDSRLQVPYAPQLDKEVNRKFNKISWVSIEKMAS